MTDNGTQAFGGHQTRENLLDVVLDKLQKSGKTNIYSRIVYVAKFERREQQIDNVREFYQKVIDKHDQAGEVSGMLLAWPACMVHMLEARTSTLMAILQDVKASPSSESRTVDARVISSTEDIPSRCFNQWYCTFVNTSSADSMDPCDSTTIVKTSCEVNAFLRKTGLSLQEQSESEVRRWMSSLDSYAENIPAPEVILSLCPADDAPTLDEYLEIFNGPANVDLDSELVWPAAAPLKF